MSVLVGKPAPDFNTDAVMQAMDALAEQIDSVPLSRRFSRTKRITEATPAYEGGTRNPSWFGLTEEAYKCRQLHSDIQRLRHEFTLICVRYKSLYLEVEASQREYD